jgi:hypothetical protein
VACVFVRRQALARSGKLTKQIAAPVPVHAPWMFSSRASYCGRWNLTMKAPQSVKNCDWTILLEMMFASSSARLLRNWQGAPSKTGRVWKQARGTAGGTTGRAAGHLPRTSRPNTFPPRI